MLIPISKIQVDRRARQDYGSIQELAEDIKTNGQISPITVVDLGDGSYRLVAGERRIRAHMMIPKAEIEAYIVSADELRIKCMELSENVVRKDFEWAERIKLVKDIDEMQRALHGSATGSRQGTSEGWSQKDTAKMLGVTDMTVSKDIQLARIIEQNPEMLSKLQNKPLTAARKIANRLVHEKVLTKAYANKQLDTEFSLIHVPCEEGIKSLKDKSVDLLITDPPFAKADIMSVGSGGGMTYAQGDNVGLEEDLRVVYEKLIPELWRVLKPGAHVYMFLGMGWYTELMSILTRQGFLMDEVPLIWFKGRVSIMAKDNHYMSSYEAILFGCKPPSSRILLKPCANCITDCPTIAGQLRVHPLQKPPQLLDRFIENSSSPGEVVLDCFAGSGSTIESAHRLHRKGIGFEKDHANYVHALEWLTGVDVKETNE